MPKISDYSAVAAIAATDELVIARPGTGSRKITAAGLLGAWQSYTPALTVASGTNPTLGSGSTQNGRWIQIGKLAIVIANVRFGTSGVAAGSGEYRVSLPVAIGSAHNAGSRLGYAQISDESAAVRRSCSVAGSPGATTVAIIPDGTLAFVSNAAPWTWAVSDDIQLVLAYEVD